VGLPPDTVYTVATVGSCEDETIKSTGSSTKNVGILVKVELTVVFDGINKA